MHGARARQLAKRTTANRLDAIAPPNQISHTSPSIPNVLCGSRASQRMDGRPQRTRRAAELRTRGDPDPEATPRAKGGNISAGRIGRAPPALARVRCHEEAEEFGGVSDVPPSRLPSVHRAPATGRRHVLAYLLCACRARRCTCGPPCGWRDDNDESGTPGPVFFQSSGRVRRDALLLRLCAPSLEGPLLPIVRDRGMNVWRGFRLHVQRSK